MFSPPAQAQEDERLPRFEPFGYLGYVYDSNPTRVADVEEVPFGDGLEDTIFTVGAGFNSRFNLSRQAILFDVEAASVTFDEFDPLDHTKGRGRLEWQWRWGQAWDGDLGYIYDRKLRDFINQSFPRADIREENRLYGSIQRQIGVRSRVRVGLRQADVEYSSSRFLSVTRSAATLAYWYETAQGRAIGLEANLVDGSFETATANDYQEWSVQGTLDWRFSEKTRLTGAFGFTQRSNDNPTRTDFDGLTGRVDFEREDARDNRYRLSVYRRPSTLGDEIANYAIVEGIQFEPEFPIGTAFELRLSAMAERRDFQGLRDATDIDPELSNRDDDLWEASAFLDWQVMRNIVVGLGYRLGQRSSTRLLEEYDFESFEFEFRVGL